MKSMNLKTAFIYSFKHHIHITSVLCLRHLELIQCHQAGSEEVPRAQIRTLPHPGSGIFRKRRGKDFLACFAPQHPLHSPGSSAPLPPPPGPKSTSPGAVLTFCFWTEAILFSKSVQNEGKAGASL